MADQDPPQSEKALVPVAPATSTLSKDDFEQRFLELAHKSNERLTVASVAYQLKISSASAEAHLEELAARDVIVRDVDDEGNLFFRLPGRGAAGGTDLASRPPASPKSINGLLVNFILPGVGTLMAGPKGVGAAQLALFVVGAGLLVTFHLIGIPLMAAAWIWGVITGIQGIGKK